MNRFRRRVTVIELTWRGNQKLNSAENAAAPFSPYYRRLDEAAFWAERSAETVGEAGGGAE